MTKILMFLIFLFPKNDQDFNTFFRKMTKILLIYNLYKAIFY